MLNRLIIKKISKSVSHWCFFLQKYTIRDCLWLHYLLNLHFVRLQHVTFVVSPDRTNAAFLKKHISRSKRAWLLQTQGLEGLCMLKKDLKWQKELHNWQHLWERYFEKNVKNCRYYTIQLFTVPISSYNHQIMLALQL